MHSRPRREQSMRTCEDCRIVLENDVRFCPKCGKEVRAEEEAGGEPDSEIRSLVASANLNRINGDWNAAIADASLALKRNPNNPEVASLLAGIYEQRGDLDEAQVWYKIATDLQPDNSAYRARLHRIDEQLAAKTGRTRGKNRSVSTWIAVGLVLVVVLAVSLYAMIGQPSRTRASHRAGKTPAADSPKQIINPMAGPSQAQSGGQPLAGSKATAAPEDSGLRTPAEVAIKAAVSGSEAVSQARASVDDVIADPRQAIATVTFSMSSGGPLTRDGVLGVAMGIARAAFAANREVKFVTVRCIMGAGASTQIAFVGDVARASVESLPDNPSTAQVDAAFTGKWWNPQIR